MVLNAHLFESVAELRALTDTWLRIYNSERPHDSLGPVPPLTFLPSPPARLLRCLLDGEAYGMRHRIRAPIEERTSCGWTLGLRRDIIAEEERTDYTERPELEKKEASEE